MGYRTRRGISRGLRYAVALVALVFFLFPVMWIVVTTFKAGNELYHSPPVWIPSQPSLVSFKQAYDAGGLKALANSLVISTATTALALLVGSLAGYGLARCKVGGDRLPFFILSQRFMPPVVIVFPFLLIFKMLGWMDTHQALVVIYLTFNLPYAVWMMRGFFMEIPPEIEEAALVDGCSPFRAFWRVAMPLVKPGLVATGVFCFIFSWSEFFFGVCITRTNAVTLAVYLPSYFGKMHQQWGQVGATSIMAMLPLFLMSIVVQRYLVRGLTLGAIK